MKNADWELGHLLQSMFNINLSNKGLVAYDVSAIGVLSYERATGPLSDYREEATTQAGCEAQFLLL